MDWTVGVAFGAKPYLEKGRFLILFLAGRSRKQVDNPDNRLQGKALKKFPTQA
jgi:hypothetical protein